MTIPRIVSIFCLILSLTALSGCVTHYINRDPALSTQQHLYQDSAHCQQDANSQISPFSASYGIDSAVYLQQCLKNKGWQRDRQWPQDGNIVILQ